MDRTIEAERMTDAGRDKSGDELALFGGRPAVVLDQTAAKRWPVVTEEDEREVLRVLRSGEWSSGHLPAEMGGYPCVHAEVLALECEFAQYMGLPVSDVALTVPGAGGGGMAIMTAPNVLAHNNGTAAILAGLHALGVGSGDEVIVPSATWWSSVLPVLHVGGVPVFAEAEHRTLALDAADVEARITQRTKAVIVTHLFGKPGDLDGLMAVCKKHGLKLMEDASHAHGAMYKGKKVGLVGDVGVFSLQGNKLVPSAEGGMLVSRDAGLILAASRFGHYERLTTLKMTGEPMGRFAATGFGYKFRMSPLSAAVARVQLRRLDERNAVRNANCIELGRRIEAISKGAICAYLDRADEPGTRRVYFEFLVRYDSAKAGGVSIKTLTQALRAEGCDVSAPRYPLLHQQPMFTEGEWVKLARLEDWYGARGFELPRYDPAALPRTTKWNGTLMKLPVFVQTNRDLMDEYCWAFERVFANLGRLSGV